MWRRVIIRATGSKRADRSCCGRHGDPPKERREVMTAFKSNRSMRLKGASAKAWANKIKAGKAQSEGGKSKKKS